MTTEIFNEVRENLPVLLTKALITLLNLSIIHCQCQIGLWIKLGHGNKSACSEWNPVQSQWTADLNQRPVQEMGVCSDSNQTADGSVQKLGNNLLHDYELSTTKVFSQISSKWNLNWKSKLVQTCIVWTSFDFQFEDFLAICSKIIVYCDTDQLKPSITRSWRSVLNFKFSVVFFLRLMTCSMSIERAKKKLSTPIYVKCDEMYW